MNIRLLGKERRSPQSIAVSLAAHVVLVAAIGAITFRFSALPADRPPSPTPVRVTYVRVAAPTPRAAPAPQRGTPTARPAPTPDPVVAIPLPVPTTIPTGVPPVTAPPVSGGAGVVGIPGGTGISASTVVTPTTGVVPVLPDPRITLHPQAIVFPRSQAALNDSVVKSAFNEYRDSLRSQQAILRRAPGDWTVDRDGQKWGWDQTGIRVGKFTIPNAIFAALPIRLGPTGNINALTDGRMQAWMQRDLADQSRGMSDADFRAAVKRIRERVDREKQEKAKPPIVAGKGPGG